MITQTSIGYFILELGIFVLLIILTSFSWHQLRRSHTKTQYFIMIFILNYAISVLFSTTAKFFKYFYDISPDAIDTFSNNYFVNLILLGRLKYLYIILANLAFHFTFHEITSTPKTQYAAFIHNFTSVVATLFLMPLFTSNFRLITQIGLFSHSLFIYIPILLHIRKLLPTTSVRTHLTLKGAVWMAGLLINLLLIALLDMIATNYLNVSYSLFYYLAWVDVLIVTGIAARTFIFSDWAEVQQTLQQTYSSATVQKEPKEWISSQEMLIECPHCHATQYLPITPTMKKKVQKSPTGITSILISEGEICPDTFVVHFDTNFKVRNVQSVDLVV